MPHSQQSTQFEGERHIHPIVAEVQVNVMGYRQLQSQL
jgi:hypothetical protein